MKLVRLPAHIVVAVDEVELARRRAVHKDTTQSCGIVVAHGVVLTIASRAVDGVLVQVGHRVQLAGRNVAEYTVHLPCPHAFGNLLVATQRVATVGVEIAVGRTVGIVALTYVAVGI